MKIDDAEAAAKAAQPWVDAWRLEIQTARCGLPTRSPAEIAQNVLVAKGEARGNHGDALAAAVAKTMGAHPERFFKAFIECGFDSKIALAEIGGPPAVQMFEQATQQRTPFLHYKDEFKALLERTRSGSTAYEYVNSVEKFAGFHGDGVTLQTFAPDHVQRFINMRGEQIGRDGEPIDPKTVRKEIGGVRKYWDFALSQDRSLDRLKPFTEIKWFEAARPKYDPNAVDFDPEQEEARFDPAQIAPLYRAALSYGDQDLGDFIAIMAWTGARREGVARLHVNTIKLDGEYPHLFFWEKDKPKDNELTMRRVAIHPIIRPIIARRVAQAARYDGYLFEGSVTAKGLRGTMIGQRLSRLLEREKIDIAGLGSHGFRRTFVDLFSRGGAAEHITAKIVGHRVPTMTYGLYASDKIPLNAAMEIMTQLIRYPDWPETDQALVAAATTRRHKPRTGSTA